MPVRIEKLTQRLPILLNAGLYINAENWAAGLTEIVDHLQEGRVPRSANVDFEKISSWWPAISADKILRQDVEEDLVSNVISISALPKDIQFIRVLSERNPITGYERLRKVLPHNPAHYGHGDYAITFASPFDLAELTHGLEFETAYSLNTEQFLETGHADVGIEPDIARNIVTALVGRAWDTLMVEKKLSMKRAGRSKRGTWYPSYGLIPNNKVSLAEPGKRKVPIHLVGSVKHYRKIYTWHFGWLPTVDLRVHRGIILNPKAVLSLPYNARNGESPAPIDDKKALKSLGWWNREWRQKLLAMLSWLSDGQPEIVIPIGYQNLVLSSSPQLQTAGMSFREISDDQVINSAMETLVEHTPAS